MHNPYSPVACVRAMQAHSYTCFAHINLEPNWRQVQNHVCKMTHKITRTNTPRPPSIVPPKSPQISLIFLQVVVVVVVHNPYSPVACVRALSKHTRIFLFVCFPHINLEPNRQQVQSHIYTMMHQVTRTNAPGPPRLVHPKTLRSPP